MRHGQATNNVGEMYHADPDQKYNLTDLGKEEVVKSSESFKNNIDIFISSPYGRAQETAKIFCEQKGFSVAQVTYDERVREWKVATDFSGKPRGPMHQYYDYDYIHNPSEKFSDGESFIELVKRAGEFIYDLDSKYSGKNIFIVSHSGFMRALSFVVQGGTFTNLLNMPDVNKLPDNAEIRQFDFTPLPHNENYELDLHKPYIDSVKLACSCGGNLTRTKEVMDVWFDSGAMPFAQDHYPFENKKFVDGSGFPADYISEAIDQTRGWFYTLHAIGVLMGRGRAYKNVICLGHLLDANGKKMSKSLGNVVDPWVMMDKYGVDTLRMWMYSVNQPGESKNFDEKTVTLLQQQVFTLLYNVLAFYELYRDKEIENNDRPNSKNILDKWILNRLDDLNKLATGNLDEYRLLEPVRAIRDFMGDLSTWYLRRSRERIKDGDKDAKQTLYFVLKNLVKIMAPFAPFAAEDVWSKLKKEEDAESVHLADWPTTSIGFFGALFGEKNILENMKVVREIVSLGLEARQKAKLPVKQALSTLKYKVESGELKNEYLELIKDELNVKEVIFDKDLASEVELDTNITPALKAEGEYREFIRELQERRKTLGLNPGDKMEMSISDIYKKYKIQPSLQLHMLRVAAVASILCDNMTVPVSKEDVITACLIHDMGNIIKFKMDVFPAFFEPEGVPYWQSVKDEYISKYGKDEHKASVQIAKEIGVSDEVVSIVDGVDFPLMQGHRDGDDFAIKIAVYSDNRVSPHGVVPYLDRMEDGRLRYKDLNTGQEEQHENLVACGAEIEKQIFAKCKIKPEDITDEAVAPIIEELRGFVIK